MNLYLKNKREEYYQKIITIKLFLESVKTNDIEKNYKIFNYYFRNYSALINYT